MTYHVGSRQLDQRRRNSSTELSRLSSPSSPFDDTHLSASLFSRCPVHMSEPLSSLLRGCLLQLLSTSFREKHPCVSDQTSTYLRQSFFTLEPRRNGMHGTTHTPKMSLALLVISLPMACLAFRLIPCLNPFIGFLRRSEKLRLLLNPANPPWTPPFNTSRSMRLRLPPSCFLRSVLKRFKLPPFILFPLFGSEASRCLLLCQTSPTRPFLIRRPLFRSFPQCYS